MEAPSASVPAARAVVGVVEVPLEAGALEAARPVHATLRARPRHQALVDVWKETVGKFSTYRYRLRDHP